MQSQIRNIVIYLSVLIAFVTIVAALYFYPQHVTLCTFSEKMQFLTLEIEAASADIEQIDHLKKEVEQAETSKQILERRLLAKSKIPNILRDITRLGMKYSLKFSALHPNYEELLQNESPDKSPLLTLPVKLYVDGDFYKLGKFLNVLDKQHFLFAIDNVDMTLNNESYPLIRATVQGNLLLKNESIRDISG